MSELSLKTSRGKTRVVVESGSLDHIGRWVGSLEAPSVVLVCTDTTVAGLYADRVIDQLGHAGLAAHLHSFPPGDASKCLAELDRVYQRLGTARVARDGLVLALGGGVVSDLAGFAAATWMRGIRYVTCPTTLESAVDACIGGKTGINHAAGKNLVGAFHHAEMVVVDPICLRTLSSRDVFAGMAESIKHALIADAAFMDWHETHRDAIRAVEPAVMAELIERNLRIKAGVVEADEREAGQRAILNFGHTIGHAIETLSNYELRHGEAVALGMVAAAELSRLVGLLQPADVARIRSLLSAFELPVTAPHRLDVDTILALTRGDKKVRAGKRRWVLLDGIGKTAIRDDIADSVIRDAIEFVGAAK